MSRHIEVVDQLGNPLTVPNPPRRIVSLVPSQTELLFDLGVSDAVVGVTKFCVHPPSAKEKAIIGGTKKFNFDKIHELSPDLIIGNKEENYRTGIEELGKHYPVWMSDILTLDDAMAMMNALGMIVDRSDRANELVNHARAQFASLTGKDNGTALYFIWQEPYMVAGKDTFVDEMLRFAGFKNEADHLTRYPELTADEIRSLNPGHILLSSEPYPFKEKHLVEFKEKFPRANVILVDGEYFSWYGSRLTQAADYFKKLGHELSQ